ncbi:MAG: TonB-dependent receptor plug domain-containing protein, partial [Rickettsiales bacterium]
MNRQKNNQSGRLALAIGLVIASTGTVQAQNNASGPRIVEEVFVTARKKEERLQDVPIAITAIDSKLLEETHATGLEDVARLTPGFAFERTVGALAQPSIRGIVQGRVSNPVQNIATYFNGVYLQRSYQIDTDMLNMERVEIYKGPQSALFGRNAFGGAISYVTRKPNLEEIEASAEISLGSDELEEFKGVLSLPLLAGKAGLSVAYTSTEFDGTWENENDIGNDLSDPEGALYTDGNVAGYDKEGYMVQFYAEPTEDLSVGAFYNHRKVFVESPANYQISSLSAIRAGGTT